MARAPLTVGTTMSRSPSWVAGMEPTRRLRFPPKTQQGGLSYATGPILHQSRASASIPSRVDSPNPRVTNLIPSGKDSSRHRWGANTWRSIVSPPPPDRLPRTSSAPGPSKGSAPGAGTDLRSITRHKIGADWQVLPAVWPGRRQTRPTVAHSRSRQGGCEPLRFGVIRGDPTKLGGELNNPVTVLADERLIGVRHGKGVLVDCDCHDNNGR